MASNSWNFEYSIFLVGISFYCDNFFFHEILFLINFVDDSGIQYSPSNKHVNAWDGLVGERKKKPRIA